MYNIGDRVVLKNGKIVIIAKTRTIIGKNPEDIRIRTIHEYLSKTGDYFELEDIDHERTKEISKKEKEQMKYEVGDKVVLKSDKCCIIEKYNELTNQWLVEIDRCGIVIGDEMIDHEKTKKINQKLKLKDGNSISYEQSEKRRTFKEITDNMLQLYKDKNEDYGDSFRKVREEYPHAIIIRLMDKLGRLKSLYKGEVNIKDEGIENVLIDMANYCVMEMVEREVENATKDVRPKC
jgi:hypothetical protein